MTFHAYALDDTKIDMSIFYHFAERYHLTPRETNVLHLMVTEGLSNSEIAKALVVQPKTITIHISNIYQKTKSNSCRELLSQFILYMSNNA